ncbi:MAG: histidine phosphatase family protein [Propionibacteriaceae bacterium]|jgi:phosphohistidine phosphatase|nr:histidine phosphatase family protein [Propionibacteriaceae bacterium]
MKTLLVERHAKSEHLGGGDHSRPLSERGVKQAREQGKILAQYPIDYVLCSSAVRARQTWENAKLGGASAAAEEFSDALYDTWADEIITELQVFDPEVDTLLIVGHEPTLSSLVWELAEPSDLRDLVSRRFPTATLAVLKIGEDWADAVPGNCELVRVSTPNA